MALLLSLLLSLAIFNAAYFRVIYIRILKFYLWTKRYWKAKGNLTYVCNMNSQANLLTQVISLACGTRVTIS